MYKNDIDKPVIDLMKEMVHRDERERPLASQLLHNPVILKGTSLYRHSDYHPHIEEDAKTILVTSPYSFKVNKSKFSQASAGILKNKAERKRPPMLQLNILDPVTYMLMEDNSPTNNQMLSPLHNKHMYWRDQSTKGDKMTEPGSAASLEKRFRGMRRSDSPLVPLDELLDVSQSMNQSRNTFRTSSVGKINHKSQLTSTKKNTGIEMHSSYGGGLFNLQRCENKDDKTLVYN
jgi:hypothetical protein